MTQRSSLVRVRLAGCHVALDRRRRMGESRCLAGPALRCPPMDTLTSEPASLRVRAARLQPLARILPLTGYSQRNGCAVCRNRSIWSVPMAKLHRSGTAEERALRQATAIRGLLGDLERRVQILNIDIYTEEERVRLFDNSDAGYPVRTLTARRDNLNRTIVFLARRLHAITLAFPVAAAEAA
jgi:hypothetical protein